MEKNLPKLSLFIGHNRRGFRLSEKAEQYLSRSANAPLEFLIKDTEDVRDKELIQPLIDTSNFIIDQNAFNSSGILILDDFKDFIEGRAQPRVMLTRAGIVEL